MRSQDEELSRERWREDEWREFELWEKIEARIARRKRGIVIAASAVFLILLAIPIYRDRLPRWGALSIARIFSQELTELKREAALSHRALTLRAKHEEGKLQFSISESEHCGENEKATHVRTKTIEINPKRPVVLLTPAQAEKLDVAQGADSFCYDPRVPFSTPRSFVFSPESDVEHESLERSVILSVEGPEAQFIYE